MILLDSNIFVIDRFFKRDVLYDCFWRASASARATASSGVAA